MNINQSIIKKCEKILLDEQKELKIQLKRNESFQLDQSLQESTGELSLYDNHPADLGTENFERGKDLALFNLREERLEEINHALQRIENGTFGYCVTCHQPIEKERLLAIPETKFCKKHATNNKIKTRPIEEDILDPTYKNKEETRDREETLIDSLAYGSSDSPQDYTPNDSRSF